MKDLQHKFDNQPVEFDRDALWEKIEKPRSPKPWWKWTALLLILLLAGYMVFNHKNEIATDDVVVIENINTDKTISKTQESNVSFTNEKRNAESLAAHSSSEHTTASSDINNTDNGQVINLKFRKTNSEKQHKISSSIPVQQELSTNHAAVTESFKNNEKAENIVTHSFSKAKSKLIQDQSEDIQRLATKFSLIESRERLQLEDIRTAVKIFDKDPVPSANNSLRRLNRIHIQGAYGQHKNHFRKEISPELEYNKSFISKHVSFNTALTYERQLLKIDLYGSLQYTVYQNNIRRIITDTISSNASVQAEYFSQTTDYDLYSNYRFLALTGGVRKEWRKGNWAFSGAIGLGTNVYAYSEEKVFDTTGDIMRFEDSGLRLNRYSFFGELEGGIRYYTRSGLYGQASLTYHSQKYIKNQFGNYNQGLSTVFINLGIGKAF